MPKLSKLKFYVKSEGNKDFLKITNYVKQKHLKIQSK